jgi:hypothetical protein
VVKWEWKIDNSAYLVCSGPDTTITPPSKYRAHYPCILRITDDNGAIDEDTMFVTTGKTWEVIGGGALSLTNTYNYSMDIDYFGTVCIVYTDSVPSYINHVFAKKLVGSAWVDMGSGSVSGSAADAVDLTIGYEQNIGYAEYYLAFHQKYVPGALILKKFNGTSWEYAPNYTQIKGDIGNAFDIELSETSVFPSIAYRDSANGYDGVVRYLNTSVNWVVRNTTISQYWTSEMALSSGGTAICWNGLGTYYIATSNSGWNIATVSGFNPKNPDILDLTKLGITNIYVSFRDGTLSNRLSVKSFNGTSWSDVGSPGISVSSASKSTLVEDRGGARDVYLAYVDYANGTFSPGIVKVSTFDGTEWINVGSTQIGTQYPLTTSPAIAVREGQLFVAFQDYNNNNRLTVMALR